MAAHAARRFMWWEWVIVGWGWVVGASFFALASGCHRLFGLLPSGAAEAVTETYQRGMEVLAIGEGWGGGACYEEGASGGVFFSAAAP